jgi:YVTN family beta-propeller protein
VNVASVGCDNPEALAVNDQGVWVGCAQSGRVVLIDTDTSSVTATLAVDGDPIALTAADDGSVWVAVSTR